MKLLDPQTTRFLKYFMEAYPSRSAVMVLLLALAGVVEGVGVVTMLPLLELVTGGGGEEASVLSRGVAGALGSIGLQPTLGVLLGLIVVAMTAKAVFLWLAMRQVGYTVAQVTTDLRMQLLRALMKARWSYYASQSTGRFANAISNEAHRAAAAYREGCVVIAGILQMLAYLTVAVLVSWQMAVATLLIGSIFLFLLRGLVGMARQAGLEQTQLMRSLVARLTDALRGIKPIRAMGRENHLQPLLERETEGLNQALRRQVRASETLRLFQEPTLAVLLALGLFGALTLGNQPFPSVLILAFIFYRLMTHANTLQTRYQVLTVGESAFWSMIEQVEEAEREREEIRGRAAPPALSEGIELEDIWFGYDETPVLRGLSLAIPAGSFVALYGPSGAGKTTIADLVIGLHRPQSGQVTADGTPLEELDLIAWRRGIGYVPQEIFLFHDTIFENVTLGDRSLGRDDVEAALRAADAWDFVSSREKGMDTVIGEAGTKLSGGQRQRISIARALVHRPRLLILDESTASLDPATEAEILETLRDLKDRVTILAISHQPAIRDTADVVYSLDRGTVTEVERPKDSRRIAQV
jgi:ATP-binding cassette, subfamily C, bacterial